MTNEEQKKVEDRYADQSSKMTVDDLNSITGKEGKVLSLFDKLGEKAAELKLLWDLLKDYKSGSYKEVPWKLVGSIIFAFVYLVSPFDVIPDFIPVLGLTDDISVFGLVIAGFSSDIEKYKTWKNNLIEGQSAARKEIDA